MSNPSPMILTGAWQLAVNTGDEFLITSRTLHPVECGSFDGDAPDESDRAHWMDPSRGEGINRGVLGPGDVYVRGPASAEIIVKAWTP